MKKWTWLAAPCVLVAGSLVSAQSEFSNRLPAGVFDVQPPSIRVSGSPGDMHYAQQDCRVFTPSQLRRRIVNVAVQEWAFFGYSVLDLVPTRESNPDYQRRPWRRTMIDPREAVRVADSIAGYWSSTPDSAWILERQNQYWDSQGPGSRWRNPWSAAFISWVMCESGLGDPREFRRAIAHHSYIDQAIMARNDNESRAAYVAFNPDEQEIEPGDMLCRGSRPSYQSIEARKRQLGEGARTHCDIVVKLDAPNERIMLIGGNVRSWVRMKLMPASINEKGYLAPVPYSGRRIFAHLKLQAESTSEDLLASSPTFQDESCEKPPIALALLATPSPTAFC